ncbi:hypothetical protein COLO4_16381 [Corchorus olitorius]|uniref:Uncharacterized protein n=1 Tax=Corchorus olitorius TaxID=93759 RepID=A0A1R3JHR1_9ROSI|nr:hypothetical protein COLO4_16381 [Corchorus olitorius]
MACAPGKPAPTRLAQQAWACPRPGCCSRPGPAAA